MLSSVQKKQTISLREKIYQERPVQMHVYASSRNSKIHSCCLINRIDLFKSRKASKFPKPNLLVPDKFKHISEMSVTVQHWCTALWSLLNCMICTAVFMLWSKLLCLREAAAAWSWPGSLSPCTSTVPGCTCRCRFHSLRFYALISCC